MTVQAPPPDPQAIAEASVESAQAILVTIVAPPPVEWANELLNFPDFWRTTPGDLTYGHPLIRDLVAQIQDHAFALIPLAILVIGLLIVIGRHTGYGGRLLFGFIVAAGSLVWWEVGIRLNNAICEAIGAPDLPSLIRPRLELTLDPAEHIGTVILTILFAIVAIVLMFSLIVRLVLIQVLIVAAPLFLICYGTPQTEGWANRYVAMASGLVFSQILIVVGFELVGAFATGDGIGSTLMAIAVLLGIKRFPGLLSSLATSQGGGSSTVVREVQRQVIRRIGRR